MTEQQVLRPVWWFFAIEALGCIAVLVLIKLIWPGMSGLVFIAAPTGVAAACYSTMALKLGPKGIELAGRSAAWEDLAITSGRWGDYLKTRPDATSSRRKRVSVFLPFYEPEWRFGVISRCLKQWSPSTLNAYED